MSHNVSPIVGQWYLDKDQARAVEVIYTDIDNDIIDLQDDAGNLIEMNGAAWNALDLEPTLQPVEFSDALDVDEQDGRQDDYDHYDRRDDVLHVAA